MSDLTDKMLAAGLHAWENCPYDDERDFRAFLAAALRVLADGVAPSRSVHVDMVHAIADEVGESS
jgi:hypothetical protein